jgi:hypothetical protein
VFEDGVVPSIASACDRHSGRSFAFLGRSASPIKAARPGLTRITPIFVDG